MKKLLLLYCCASLFGCTKEPADLIGGNSSGAVVVGTPSSAALKGTLAVKLSPEGARAVAAAQPAVSLTRSGVATRSGIEDIDQVLTQIGAEAFERIIAYDPEWEAAYDDTGINRWYNVSFGDDVALAEAGKLLAARPEIAIVEYMPDPRFRRPACVGPAVPFTEADAVAAPQTRASNPGVYDPLLAYQWQYDNMGASGGLEECQTPPVAGADIDLFDAWRLCKGSPDVIVAVIDQPVQTNHPDLQANIWSNPKKPGEHGYNFWNQTSKLDWKSFEFDASQAPGQQYEYADHGTHVAGTIAAVNNNGRGVCGIAGGNNGRGVKIMSCQIMGYSDENTKGNGYADVKAFEYALKNGAIIAQNSWGYPELSQKEWLDPTKTPYSLLRDAIDTFVKYAGSKNPSSPLKGGLVFFAAGNEGDVYKDARIYPAAYDPVIAVGAMDWAFLPAYYTDYGSWVDISAPGGDAYDGMTSDKKIYSNSMILSTVLCDDSIDYQDGRKQDANFYGYGFLQGTSMACPHVSGVAALGLSYAAQLGKQYTAEEFRALLLSSVYGIDNYFEGMKQGQFAPFDLSVYLDKMGGGCIDALKLLLEIQGTPAIYVKTGEKTTVNFASFFGGDDSRVVFSGINIPAADLARIGMSAQPVTDGSRLTFDCSKPGTAVLTISARAGDTYFEREFVIVSRAGLAGNGGWL